MMALMNRRSRRALRRVLVAGDVAGFQQMAERAAGKPMSDDRVALVAFHKVRADFADVPDRLRRDSCSWLIRNGFLRFNGLPVPRSEEDLPA